MMLLSIHPNGERGRCGWLRDGCRVQADWPLAGLYEVRHFLQIVNGKRGLYESTPEGGWRLLEEEPQDPAKSIYFQLPYNPDLDYSTIPMPPGDPLENVSQMEKEGHG